MSTGACGSSSRRTAGRGATPGPAGYGAVVREAGTGEVLLERSASLGITTNNVAEYPGLIAGLRAAAELGATRVDVRMDSKLVVEQMSGRWQIKNPGLRPLAAEAAKLVDGFAAVTFDWIPRERNKHADALANRGDGRGGRQARGRRHRSRRRSRWHRRRSTGLRPRPRPRRTGRRRRWTPPPGSSWSGTARPR